MQSNGNPDSEKVRSMLLMMMYLVQEAEDIKLERTKSILQKEIELLLKEYDLTEDTLIPEAKD